MITRRIVYLIVITILIVELAFWGPDSGPECRTKGKIYIFSVIPILLAMPFCKKMNNIFLYALPVLSIITVSLFVIYVEYLEKVCPKCSQRIGYYHSEYQDITYESFVITTGTNDHNHNYYDPQSGGGMSLGAFMLGKRCHRTNKAINADQ